MTDEQQQQEKRIAIGGDFAAAARRTYSEFETDYLPDRTIRVQSMTERERVSVVVDCSKPPQLGNSDAMTALLCLVDDRGRRLFEDSQIQEILDLPTGLVQQIANEVDALSGIRPKTNAKKTEDTKKNSKPTTTEDSPSA